MFSRKKNSHMSFNVLTVLSVNGHTGVIHVTSPEIPITVDDSFTASRIK
jgi:hypothetical protein